jgi:hypothetical protein
MAKRGILLLLASALLSASGLAQAEIEKLAIPCETRLCVHWWPRLPRLAGWHHDREHSLYHGANALAPDGFTFKDAETVIYARALYKPRVPDTPSLASLIEADKRELLEKDPTIVIAEAEAMTTGDGQALRSFTFLPREDGNWERVAYGEEGDFFLLFTISSRSREGFRARAAAFEDLIRRYRKDLPAEDAAGE